LVIALPPMYIFIVFLRLSKIQSVQYGRSHSVF